MFHPKPPRKDTVPPPSTEIADDRGETKYFHGREKEVGGFLKKLSESKDRKTGPIFLVQGPPGVGKTALLGECRKRAEQEYCRYSARGTLGHRHPAGMPWNCQEKAEEPYGWGKCQREWVWRLGWVLTRMRLLQFRYSRARQPLPQKREGGRIHGIQIRERQTDLDTLESRETSSKDQGTDTGMER